MCALHCVIDQCGVCSTVALLDTVCMLFLRAEDSVSETFQLVCCGFAVVKSYSVLEWVKASCLFTVHASICTAFCVFKVSEYFLLNAEFLCTALSLFFTSLFLMLCPFQFTFVYHCFDYVLIFLLLYFHCLHFHAVCFFESLFYWFIHRLCFCHDFFHLLYLSLQSWSGSLLASCCVTVSPDAPTQAVIPQYMTALQ